MTEATHTMAKTAGQTPGTSVTELGLPVRIANLEAKSGL